MLSHESLAKNKIQPQHEKSSPCRQDLVNFQPVPPVRRMKGFHFIQIKKNKNKNGQSKEKTKETKNQLLLHHTTTPRFLIDPPLVKLLPSSSLKLKVCNLWEIKCWGIYKI